MNPQGSQQPQMIIPNQPGQQPVAGQPIQPAQPVTPAQPLMGQLQPMPQAQPQVMMPGQSMPAAQPNAAMMGSAAMQAQQKAPVSPNKDVPTSTQATLLISELRDNVVIMKDGSFRAVVACKSINFDLMSDMEREGVE